MLEVQRHSVQKVKLITLGMLGVGKTSIINRFTSDKFSEDPPPFQTAFSKVNCTLPEGKHVQFHIWDIGNMERSRSLPPIYLRKAKIVLCIYDTTLRASFENMKHWVDEAISQGPSHMVIAIVGNKSDLQNQREVTNAEAMEYARQIGGIFKLVSAKDSKGIVDLFSQVGEEVFKKPNPQKFNLPCLKIQQIARRASCW